MKEAGGSLTIRKKPAPDGLRLLAGYECLRQYNQLFVHEVTELKNTKGYFTLMLIEKHLTVLKPKRHATKHLQTMEVKEVEPVIVFNLDHDMGKVFVKEETIGEKIADVLLKVDIDFKEYPAFSKNYFVVGEKPDLVKQHFPKALLETLSVAKEMNIEIDGKRGLLRPQKNLTRDILLKLLHIGHRLTS